MITSNQNAKVQWVRKLLTQKKERLSSNCYVMEGVRLIEDAMEQTEPIRLVLFSEPVSERTRAILDRVQSAQIEFEEVSVPVMKSLSDTETPQGILAVAEMRAGELPKKPNFVLILDAIHDPGNLGTIFRTAAAAGADLLLLSPQCADPYAPKVIRSGMGAHLKLPFRQLQWQEISAFFLQFPEIRILASDMEGGLPHWRHDLTQPLALIIGSEAEGICQQAEQLASEKIFIPMAERVESLNAAVAAGILMFETVRQREVKK